METEHDDAIRDGGALSAGGNIDYIEFLKKVLPDDGWSVLVAIHPQSGKTHGLGVSRQTIEKEVRPWVEKYGEWNLYWSPNSLSERLDKKPKKANISNMEWVHLDYDDPSPEALERLRNYEVPPTLIVFSGGGYQGFWRLRHPIHVNGNIRALEAANVRVLQDLDPKHMGTQNLDRIMRLPGTVNWPTKTKLASGRKPTEARLIEVHPDRTYRLEDFLAPAQTPVEVVAKKAKSETVDRSAVLFRNVLRDVRDHVSYDEIQETHANDPHVLSQPEERRWGTIDRCIAKAHDLIAAESEAVKEMNAKHALVFVGSRIYFLWRDRWNDGIPLLMGRADMVMYYAKYPGKPFEVWSRSRERAEVSIVFEPGAPAAEGKFNIWRGFSVTPDPNADCSLFLKMVLDVICSGDADLYKYVMAWCADAVQNPAKRPGVVLVLKGGQGTGKGTFARAIGELFGDHYVYANRSRHVTGNFNAHQANKLLMFADEALFAGDRASEGALKSLITEDELMVEMKGKDVIKLRNHIRIIMASNQDWAVPAALDDRRFAVIDVSPLRKQDSGYFKPIKTQLESGGDAGLLHYLQTFDLGGIELRNLPATNARLHEQMRSLDTEHSWWLDMLQSKDHIAPPYKKSGWSFGAVASTQALYASYLEHCDDMKRNHRLSLVQFGIKMWRHFLPDANDKKREATADECRRFGLTSRTEVREMPSLAEARKRFEVLIGRGGLWPSEADASEDPPM